MSITVVRYSERPELWDDTEALSRAVWPEYNLHGAVLNSYWNRTFDDFPDFQFALFDDEQGEVLAEGHTLPCPWDGTTEGLGDGIDAMTVAAFEAAASGRRPTALCAMAAEVDPRFQGSGLADRVLVNVWSEFGRRPEENGSGTDHGAAGLSLLVGTQAKGTLVGEFPGLATLDEDDNLRHTTDFRAVYCSLLEQWLGVDATGIIPKASTFARPVLVR